MRLLLVLLLVASVFAQEADDPSKFNDLLADPAGLAPPGAATDVPAQVLPLLQSTQTDAPQDRATPLLSTQALPPWAVSFFDRNIFFPLVSRALFLSSHLTSDCRLDTWLYRARPGRAFCRAGRDGPQQEQPDQL